MPLFIFSLCHSILGEAMSYDVLTNKKSGLDYLHINRGSKTAICILHGYGASMGDLYGLSDMIKLEKDVDWYFPNGFLDISMGMGASSRAWFPIDVAGLETAMARGEHRDFSKNYSDEFDKALQVMQVFLDDLIINKYDEIILGGFSQGSMVTSHLSLKNSRDVNGLLCFSGTLLGQAELVKYLETSTKFPFFQSHGKGDPILGYGQAKSLFELMKLGGHQGEFVGFDGVHEIPVEVMKKSQKYLNRVLGR
jgi:phospholipase/carboxylesterase